ncbi:hypothetical protein AGMMS49944_11460 [Spirochaetia bacterium]|nr:hypothetical protein AGMMS49944_11460 [Spirochaetia bacterium]
MIRKFSGVCLADNIRVFRVHSWLNSCFGTGLYHIRLFFKNNTNRKSLQKQLVCNMSYFYIIEIMCIICTPHKAENSTTIF